MNAQELYNNTINMTNWETPLYSNMYWDSLTKLIESRDITQMEYMKRILDKWKQMYIEREMNRREMFSKMTEKEIKKFINKEKREELYRNVRYKIRSFFNLRLKIVGKDEWDDFKNS